jgi:hypothetical protein
MWMAQSDPELLSASNSLIIRESTGNFFDFGPYRTAPGGKGLCLVDHLSKFPTQRNRELFKVKKESI